MNGIGVDIGGTSTKLAAVDHAGRVLWTVRSPTYSRPTVSELTAAIRAAAAGRVADLGDRGAIVSGVCVPGMLGADRSVVDRSVNVPALKGIHLDGLVEQTLGVEPAALTVATDTYATAYDLYRSRRPEGRMLVLAIGTGVGAAVLDEGRPLSVDGDSPGHFGQLDVSLAGDPVVGPDGGAGSLEGYLSAAALASRFGPEPGAWVDRMTVEDPAMRALVRAIRIAHALYRPRHVFLAGGIGIRLGALQIKLYTDITRQLTSIARPDWTLSTGDSDFHAAQGAARLALESARQGLPLASA